LRYTRPILATILFLAATLSITLGNDERLEEDSFIQLTRSLSLALTPDQERLCVVRNIISSEDPRGGLMLVDLETNEVLDTDFFVEEGRLARVAASEDPDGTTYCFVAVTQQTGDTGSSGRNRVEVVNVTNDQVEIKAPIILEGFQASAFGPVGIYSDPVKKRLYVADRGHARVHIIDNDPASGENRFQILASVPSLGTTISVATTPDGGRAYAANRAQSNVICIDTSTNTVGGPACGSIGTIPVSIGPSGAGTAIAISPDGKRAYTVFNMGPPCVSVIDIEPASATFNQEVAVIPTTGQTLHSVAVSPDGSQLFVVSGTTQELLVFDTAASKQTQRIPAGRNPSDVVSQPTDSAVAYVSNSSSQTISIIRPGKGAFISPDGDTRKTDGMWDFEDDLERCEDPSRPGIPDPGIDAPPVWDRPEINHFVFSGIDNLDKLIEVFCFDPHPVTGSWTSCEFILPPVEETEGLMGSAARFLFQLLDISEARQHRVTIDGYDAGFRPQSAVIESQIKHDDGTTTTVGSSFEMRDHNNDGVTDGLTIDAGDLVTTNMLNFTTFDSDDDGIEDFVGSNLSLGELVSFAAPNGLGDFLPLADTNGDGVPDSPAYDFDGDGAPDPEFPLFPFLAGPSNPKDRDLWLYFAQFGDGGSGGPANLFSQVLLLNLDTDNPAQVTIFLKDDDGNPLNVDLNGEEVAGEKTFAIPAGGLKVLETDGQGPLIVGSASVRSDRAVAGVIVFGGSAGLAGVGSSQVMRGGFLANIETDSNLQISTGFAVMNLDSGEGIVNLTLEDTNGSILARGQLTLKGMGHRALFVDQIEWTPETGVQLDFSEFRGLLRASVDGKMAATVLETRPGEFATLPVARSFKNKTSRSRLLPPAQDALKPDQKLFFPQIADGGVEGVSTRSQILLFNLTDQTANVRVVLKDDAGDPLTIDLNGEVVVGEKEIQIPPGALRILESDGQGELTVGSVTVCSDQALAGVIVFAGETGAAGVGASSPLLKSFLAPMESNDAKQVNTGIAVMNLETEEVGLTATLCDEANRTLATASLNLSGMGHRALFLNQFDWKPQSGETMDFSDFRGILKITSTRKVAAAVLQTRTGIFATQPVVPALR